VDDLDAVTKAIAKHGGRIIMDSAPVPTVGTLTKFEDTEGNVLGAMAYEHEPHT
jgi:predicted enzyme related to lactoylglutathione lyase